MSQPNASLARLSVMAVLASLLCAQGACSWRSLDYLKNGQPHDGAAMVSRDADIERYPRTDVSGFDAASLDTRAQGGPGDLGETGGTDGTSGDNWNWGDPDGGAVPDLETDLNAADDKADDLPVMGAEDAGADETLDATTLGDDGDSVEGGPVDALPGHDPDLSTGGVTGTGGTGGTGGNGDARAGTDGSSGGDAGVADTSTSCAGLGIGGICWYLGSQGLSCQQVCASHGQPAPTAASHVGASSQGGSLAECRILFGLLGVNGTANQTSRTDGIGLGCHVMPDGKLWWLISPDFSVTASVTNTRLVCGCTQ